MGTATAVTDAGGAFSVKHSKGVSGAEVGKYVVVLQAPEGDKGEFFKLMPRDYYEGGNLAVEIKEGMSPLDLKVITKT